jgi:hypothetical protein
VVAVHGGLATKEEEAWLGAPKKVSGSAVQLANATHLGSSEARHSDAAATGEGGATLRAKRCRELAKTMAQRGEMANEEK